MKRVGVLGGGGGGITSEGGGECCTRNITYTSPGCVNGSYVTTDTDQKIDLRGKQMNMRLDLIIC